MFTREILNQTYDVSKVKDSSIKTSDDAFNGTVINMSVRDIIKEVEVEALIDLLIEKGVFTEEEFDQKFTDIFCDDINLNPDHYNTISESQAMNENLPIDKQIFMLLNSDFNFKNDGGDDDGIC